MAAPPPHRPTVVRLLNRFGPRIAPRWPSLDPDTIIAAAAAKAKAPPDDDPSFRDALPRLIASVHREAQLTFIGRVACRQSIEAGLEARFALYAHRARNPDIASQPIHRPVFIVGLPRTGTTILFNLLAQDPANRAPLGWEAQFPNPPPETESYETDARIRKADKYFGQMEKMAPALPAIHEVGAQLPQECMPIMAHTLLSPQAYVTFNVPSYQAWVDDQDAAPAYRYHRHFLQHLQSRHMRDRWVLKSPVHLATLDALLDAYPDARIIFTHRDPAKTIPSLASLVYTVRGIASDAVDPHRVGQQQLEWWADAVDHASAVRERYGGGEAQFFDIQFEDIVADPVQALARAYERFDLPWSGDVERRMRQFIVDNPRGKHGVHRYALDDFGLTAEEIWVRLGAYCERYGVQEAR